MSDISLLWPCYPRCESLHSSRLAITPCRLPVQSPLSAASRDKVVCSLCGLLLACCVMWAHVFAFHAMWAHVLAFRVMWVHVLASGVMWAHVLAACRNLSTVYKELQQRSERQQNLSAMAGDKVMQRAVMVSQMPLLISSTIGAALAHVLQTLHVMRLSKVCTPCCSGCVAMLAATA